MPKSMVIKHKYVSAHSLDAGINTLATQVFKWNDMFDPDQTGGATGQPRGYDQMAVFYNYYRVLRARAFVTFTHESNTETAIVFCGTKRSATAPADQSEVYEGQSFVKKLIGPSQTTPTYLKYNVRPTRWIGSRAEAAHLSGPVGGSPDEIIYFHVGTFAMDTTVNPGTVFALITVWFECLWYNTSITPAST